jgi:hypothetical protein
MPGLTVTEKEFWKGRIAARIEKRLEAIKAAHPALFERVKRQGHAEALESLGLAGPYAELEAVQAGEAALARRKRQAQRAMLAALRGVPVEEVEDAFIVRHVGELSLPGEAAAALAKRQAAHQERLLAEDPVGGAIARLEAERERLLDVVWLATSPAEVRALWSKVGELLGDGATELERAALALAPAKED